MNTLLMKATLSTAIALTIAGCGSSGGGGGGSTAGIGGSGFVSSGSVSGFGSVFVNGVEFETDSATFDVDGAPGTQDDLAIGMVVKVHGSINDDGETGTATSISFDDEIQGPVSSVTEVGNDGVKLLVEVLGVTIIIDSGSTTFDVDSSLAGTPFDFDTITVSGINNNVEVSGFFDSNGDLQATRIELKDIVFDTSSVVEIEGVITNYVDDSNFQIEGNPGITVDASAPATFDNLPNGLEDGQLVEVVGTLDAGLTTLTASQVEGEDNSVADTDEFEIEGIITDYVSDSNFKIGDIVVDASGATFEPFALSLENDIRIEAEGKVVNGVLIASEIELEGGDLKVHAKVSAINLGANSFEVVPNPLTGEAITVTVEIGTQIEDDVSGLEELTLLNIAVDNFVEVRGFDDGSGGIAATEVAIKDPGDVLVRGEATAATGDAASGGTITVLGVTFDFDAVTDFEDVDESNMIDVEINALISDINNVLLPPQLLKIEDKEVLNEINPVGTADAIDVE